MTRLDTICPELVKKLRLATADKRRVAALAATEMAVSESHIEHPLVKRGLQHLRTEAVFTTQQRADLDDLVTKLDDRYFTLHEAVEEGHSPTEDYKKVFATARAVAALTFAGGKDSFKAATEAIYEAAAAVGGNQQQPLFALAHSKLE